MSAAYIRSNVDGMTGYVPGEQPTDKSLIKNFSLSTPGKKPFAQPEISLVADLELNPEAKNYTVKKFNLQSDQIKVSFAPARLTTEKGTSTLVGKADGRGA